MVRGAENSSWRTLTPQSMPEKWRREYDDFLANEGRVTKDMRTCGAFALAKMIKAYQKALKELGYGSVEVMLGSLAMGLCECRKLYNANGCSFIPLDYSYVLNQPSTQYKLFQIGDRRKLIPVVWLITMITDT